MRNKSCLNELKKERDIGQEVVPSSYRNYTVNSQTQNIQENTVHFSARKISLIDIRKRLLEKHESLGIVRDSSNEYFDSLSVEDIMQLSQKLGCTADNMQ